MTHASLHIPSVPNARRPLGPWLGLGIALAAGLVYANSLWNGFAFDDVAIVKNNPHVKDLMWTTIWTDNYWPMNEGVQPDSLYRPLTLWSYLANEWIAPGIAWPFHLVNVLLHMLVSVLVGMLTWRILGDRRIAFVAGLIFAVHPLHTEAVANTVGRAEILAACWTLLALLIYIPARGLGDDDRFETRPWWHGLLVGTCFFAAILSKETPVTLLLAIPFIDLWRYFRMPAGGGGRPRFWRWGGSQFLRYYLPLGVFFAIYMVLRINACGLMTDVRTTHPIVNILVKAEPMERLITPFGLLAKYLALTFWPVHLSADYSAPSIMPTANPLSPMPLIGILVCVLAGILCWRHRSTLPRLALVVGLFFISYVLVSNAVRIGTIFGERLFYWPSAFVIVLVAWAAVRIYEKASAQRRLAATVAGWAILAVALGAMGVRTWVRNTDWQDNLPLAIATGRDNPMSAKACHWAATVLIFSKDPSHLAFAKELLERALELYPDFAPPRWELAKYYGRKGDLGLSLVHLCRAVRLDPGTRDTRTALTGIRRDLEATDPARYMPAIEENLAANPQDETAHLAMAMALHAQKKFDEAERHAIQAVELGKGNGGHMQFHEAAAELATIRFNSGNKIAGVNLFREYVIHVRNSVMARCHMAGMLMELDTAVYPNAYAEAQMNLDRAQSIDPRNPTIRETRARLNRIRSGLDATASAIPSHAPAGPSPNNTREAP